MCKLLHAQTDSRRPGVPLNLMPDSRDIPSNHTLAFWLTSVNAPISTTPDSITYNRSHPFFRWFQICELCLLEHTDLCVFLSALTLFLSLAVRWIQLHLLNTEQWNVESAGEKGHRIMLETKWHSLHGGVHPSVALVLRTHELENWFLILTDW